MRILSAKRTEVAVVGMVRMGTVVVREPAGKAVGMGSWSIVNLV